MKAHSKELVHAQQDAIAAAVGNDKDALADALNMHADALAEIVKAKETMWTVSHAGAYLRFRTFMMGAY